VFSMLIIGVLALAGLAKWLLAPARERIDLELTPEDIELFGEYFDFEDEMLNYEEMRKTNPHIWIDETENFDE
jgi:hypothetical protein